MITLFSLSPMELANSIVTPKYDLWTLLTHIPNGHMIAVMNCDTATGHVTGPYVYSSLFLIVSSLV